VNRVWVADITYIPLKKKNFAYLALTLDLCSRREIGWSMAEQMTETLVVDELQQAIRARQPPPALVHHSDRGGQYAGAKFRGVLRRAAMRCDAMRCDRP
jgi:transposase InsO family protein